MSKTPEIEACPHCGKVEARQKDCGYSSFNPVWTECPCGYRLEGTLANWNRALKALRSKARIPAATQKLANALARLMPHESLEKLFKERGKSWL